MKKKFFWSMIFKERTGLTILQPLLGLFIINLYNTNKKKESKRKTTENHRGQNMCRNEINKKSTQKGTN